MVVSTDDCSMNFLWNSLWLVPFHWSSQDLLNLSVSTCTRCSSFKLLWSWAVHLHVVISYHVWSALAYDHLVSACFALVHRSQERQLKLSMTSALAHLPGFGFLDHFGIDRGYVWFHAFFFAINPVFMKIQIVHSKLSEDTHVHV